jgi:hypothetical protein
MAFPRERAYGCVQGRTGAKKLPWKGQHNLQGNDDRRDRF